MLVSILPGCIACQVCASLCPEVFTVTDVAEADNTQVPGHEQACRNAARACPVNVIAVQE